MEEHIIWWNKLTKERRQEINEIHFSCKVGEESDFDIHRAFTNLYIKQLSNHEMWWNSITHARKTKLAMTYFNFEDYGFLKDEEIQHIFNKVKNYVTLVNVKPEKPKPKELTEKEKKTLRKYDRLTTLLGLTTSLRDFFEISRFLGEGLFKQELKQKATIFENELIATMERYYSKDDREKPKKETKEQLEKRIEEKKERNDLQMNQLNNLSVILETVVSVVCQISEIDDKECNKYLKEQEKLFKKYNIFHGALLAHLNNEHK